jgi:hypothetical protein
MQNLTFCRGYNVTILFSKSTKEIFNMKEAWKSPNTLPTMVHIQAYHIIN